MKSPTNRLSENLREAIEEEIATGKLRPGTHLDELELANRFGVSRTPIREALILLQSEGLVDNRLRKGSVVVQVSPARLMEMFEVMAELEAMCARLAVRRSTPLDMAALEVAHEECRAAVLNGDTNAYFYANERFHFAMYAASHNSFLAEQSTQLQRRLRPYRRLQLRVRNRLQRSFAEHQLILDALKSGDVDGAVENVRNHVVVQGERFADLVACMEQLATQDDIT